MLNCCMLCVFCRFYPFHYAPYMSDVRNFSELEIKFELGTPFLPFEQLLAVLPAASRQLLPKPFQVRYMYQVLINFIRDVYLTNNSWEFSMDISCYMFCSFYCSLPEEITANQNKSIF